MNGSLLAEGGREVPLVRGCVVSFRPSARIAMLPARRPPRFMPGVLIRLDERRVPRRPGRSSKIKWFVAGSGATLLLFFVKLILPWSTMPTRRLDMKHEPETNTDAGTPAPSGEFSPSAGAEHRS